MGKGDKKTRRGKLFMGSYGNTRPKNAPAKIEKTEKAKAKAK
ncbi:MAG: 30S ribosomal protein THX [Bacteroidales bacterium]|nr:30S ribosomal protein THX [Bacteroidales bacterium]